MDGAFESFETDELMLLPDCPQTYADPSPPPMPAVTLEMLAIKRVCAERLKNKTEKLKAQFDAQTKELTDARAEATFWRNKYESQAAVKELKKLKKDMERAALSTNEAIQGYQQNIRSTMKELQWYRTVCASRYPGSP
jgi:chromosome segregation ATPase